MVAACGFDPANTGADMGARRKPDEADSALDRGH